jgi:PAS domain S-box-containing protein
MTNIAGNRRSDGSPNKSFGGLGAARCCTGMTAPNFVEAISPRKESNPVISFNELGPQIWDAFPFSVVVSDYVAEPKQRKIVYVNSAFTHLTGFAAEEVIGKPLTLLDGPGTDPTRSAECEATLKDAKTYEATFLHYRKDGSKYLSRATVAPLLDQDGSAKFLMLIEMMASSIEPPELTANATRISGFGPLTLTLPMPLREYPSARTPEHLRSRPELDALRALWTRIRGDREIPQRSEFDLGTVMQWVPHLSIATATPDGRFEFRLFGTELTRLYGRNLTGSVLDDLTPKDLWSVVILHYREVVRTRKPLFAPISISNGRWYNEVSRLLLPLSDGDERVAFVMGADYARLA